MPEMVIRPSLKKMKWGLFIAVVVLAAVVYLYVQYREDVAWWVLFVALIPFIAPLLGWMDARRVRLTLSDGIVTYETGLMKKERKLSAASEVAGIDVERTFSQRLWGTGNLLVETRGPSGRFVVPDIDRPKQTANALRNAVQPSTPGEKNPERKQ